MQITALAMHKYPHISFQWCNELNSRSTKRPPRQLYSARSFFLFSKKTELEERVSGNRTTRAHTHTQDRLSISKGGCTSHPVVWVTMSLSGGSSCHGDIKMSDVSPLAMESDKKA